MLAVQMDISENQDQITGNDWWLSYEQKLINKVCHNFFNNFRCKKVNNKCRMGDMNCLKKPVSLSYNFLAIISSIPVSIISFTFNIMLLNLFNKNVLAKFLPSWQLVN